MPYGQARVSYAALTNNPQIMMENRDHTYKEESQCFLSSYNIVDAILNGSPRLILLILPTTEMCPVIIPILQTRIQRHRVVKQLIQGYTVRLRARILNLEIWFQNPSL